MNRIEKFLRKLPPRDLERILFIINKLENNDLSGLDIKKLTGYTNIYRVKHKDIRIILLKNPSGFNIVSIERRGDNTYKL